MQPCKHENFRRCIPQKVLACLCGKSASTPPPRKKPKILGVSGINYFDPVSRHGVLSFCRRLELLRFPLFLRGDPGHRGLWRLHPDHQPGENIFDRLLIHRRRNTALIIHRPRNTYPQQKPSRTTPTTPSQKTSKTRRPINTNDIKLERFICEC